MSIWLSRPGVTRLLLVGSAAILIAASYVAAFGLPRSGAQTASYTGCVHTFTGDLRVLLFGSTCNAGEVPISLGATGPPGPAGTALAAAQFTSSLPTSFSSGEHALRFNPGPSFGSSIAQPGVATFRFDDPGIYRVDFVLQGLWRQVEEIRLEVDGVAVGDPLLSPDVLVSDPRQLVGSRLLEITSAGSILQLIMVVETAGVGFLLEGSTVIITQLTSTSP